MEDEYLCCAGERQTSMLGRRPARTGRIARCCVLWPICADEEKAWGNNWAGQADVPDDLGPVVAVSAGYAQTCTLASNGRVTLLGRCYERQAFLPTWVVVYLMTGYGTTCVIEEGGLARCWGADYNGLIPADLGTVVALHGGNDAMCHAEGYAALYANDLSQKGDVPAMLPGVVDAAVGEFHSCGLSHTGYGYHLLWETLIVLGSLKSQLALVT